MPSVLNAKLLTAAACQCRVSLARLASRTSLFLPACPGCPGWSLAPPDEAPAAAATADPKPFQMWMRPLTSPAAMRSSRASNATHCTYERLLSAFVERIPFLPCLTPFEIMGRQLLKTFATTIVQ